MDMLSRLAQIHVVRAAGIKGRDYADAITAWCDHYGVPARLISDNAGALRGGDVATAMSKLGIHHHLET